MHALQAAWQVGAPPLSSQQLFVYMTLGRGLEALVRFRSFLRLVSFLYLLSLRESPSRNTGFSLEVKAT